MRSIEGRRHSFGCAVAAVLFAAAVCAASAEPLEPLWTLAQKEKSAVLDTMKALVEIESGSREIEGLDRIADAVAQRLRSLGGTVTLVEPERESQRGRIGKMVRASFTGSGTKKVLLLAHMDTVYPSGMLAKQPFRIDSERAWGLGILDDRQGIAVILHALAVLNAADYRGYGTITVLINGDEEIGSPASRPLITHLGSEHDAVMSFEGGGGPDSDTVRLMTSGTATAILTVRGRASHAGARPEAGINALYELAHQIMQMRDLSDPALGIKVNWTLARAGVVRNMIPPEARGEADIRVERIEDLDAVESRLRERIKTKLLPDAEVTLQFRRGRPALQASAASHALARHAQEIFREIGRPLSIPRTSTGGGTDAAYAALKARGPVIEGFGLRGYGAHSTDAEYVMIESIAPRLYLAARMIIDISDGRAPLAGKP